MYQQSHTKRNLAKGTENLQQSYARGDFFPVFKRLGESFSVSFQPRNRLKESYRRRNHEVIAFCLAQIVFFFFLLCFSFFSFLGLSLPASPSLRSSLPSYWYYTMAPSVINVFLSSEKSTCDITNHQRNTNQNQK